MELFKCVRCGHEWYARKPGKPRACGKCKCINWDKPATGIANQFTKPKYPELAMLQPGQTCYIPYYTKFSHDLPTNEHLRQANAQIFKTVKAYARRHGWKIFIPAQHTGALPVKRIS